MDDPSAFTSQGSGTLEPWTDSPGDMNLSLPADDTSQSIISYFPPGFRTMCFILAGVIVSLNGIVILAYILARRVRRTMSLFVLNLAIVDFQNGCVSLPLLLVFPRTELVASPAGGDGVCVVLIAWPQILFIVAIQSVLLVTLERFICVAKPYTHRKLLRKWRCFLVLIVVWLLAVCFSIMPAFAYDRITSKGSLYMCDGLYQQGIVYAHVFLYGLLGTPVILIVILYCLMYRIARKHTKSINKLQSTCVLTGEAKQKQTQIVQTSKAAKTAGLLSAFYLLCWLPFLILLQVSELCKLGHCSASITTENLQRATAPTLFLAFLGCAINPVIYIFRTGSIRASCKSAIQRWRLHNAVRRESSPNSQARSSITGTKLRHDDKGYSLASLHSIF